MSNLQDQDPEVPELYEILERSRHTWLVESELNLIFANLENFIPSREAVTGQQEGLFYFDDLESAVDRYNWDILPNGTNYFSKLVWDDETIDYEVSRMRITYEDDDGVEDLRTTFYRRIYKLNHGSVPVRLVHYLARIRYLEQSSSDSGRSDSQGKHLYSSPEASSYVKSDEESGEEVDQPIVDDFEQEVEEEVEEEEEVEVDEDEQPTEQNPSDSEPESSSDEENGDEDEPQPEQNPQDSDRSDSQEKNENSEPESSSDDPKEEASAKQEVSDRGKGEDNTTPQSSNSSVNQRTVRGEASQSRTLFIKGFDTSREEYKIKDSLRGHFSTCGEITRIFLPRRGDPESGVIRGIAFIDLKDGFDEALKLNRTKLEGFEIVVETAKPKVEIADGPTSNRRPGRDRGPGGRGRDRGLGGRFSRGPGRTSNKPSVLELAKGKKTFFDDDE